MSLSTAKVIDQLHASTNLKEFLHWHVLNGELHNAPHSSSYYFGRAGQGTAHSMLLQRAVGYTPGKENGQTDRQMEGHMGGQTDNWNAQSVTDRLVSCGQNFPVLGKRLYNTGRKGSGPTRLQMDSNISLACYTQLHVTTYCHRRWV